MLSWVVIIRSTLRRRSPKSLPLNSFADPHPLTPVPSILYRKHGGRGTKPLRRSDVCSLHPEGGNGTQFASRMNLSPLECAVAAKHRVLPVFSRNRLTSSLLESTLMSTIVSVDSKWFTGMLTRLESALTKKHQGVGPSIGPCVPLRALVPLWQSPGVHGTGGHGPRCLPHPSHCSATPLVPQSPKVPRFFTIRGNNSAPPVSKSMRADIGDRFRFGPLCKSCLGSAGWLAIQQRVGKAGSVRLG